MQFTTTAQSLEQSTSECLIAGIFSDGPLPPTAEALNRHGEGWLQDLIDRGDIATKIGHTTVLHGIPGTAIQRLIVAGCGARGEFGAQAYHKACRAAGKALRQSPARQARCQLPELQTEGHDTAWHTQVAARDLDHQDYRYSETKKPEDNAPPPTERVEFPAADGVDEALRRAAAIATGTRSSRDLGDLPPNLCTPGYIAEHARRLAAKLDNVEVEVLDEQAMEQQGMTSLLAVARGSANPPRLVVMHYRGGGDRQPLVLIGKGVTFDTGGISLKPRENMDQMKYDMCGAASVIGSLEACARMALPLNVTAVAAAVENMPDGRAYRPGDVIRTMSGQTVEVLNTDAEGRMILCDAMTWVDRNLDPAVMIDVATLTGACVVALGHHANAVMSKHDKLAEELLAAGESSLDRGWRLPLWDEYHKQLETPFADLKNIGGMPAGSITAGCFLSRFAGERVWAHLDIAGSAWVWGSTDGASGRPVPLLSQWLIDRAAG